MTSSSNKRGIRVGILTFGDGRDFLQKPLKDVNQKFLDQLVNRLEGDGFDVVTGTEVLWQNEVAVREGRRMAAENVDCVIFNFSVWAWPQYSRMAAQFLPQPILMFSDINPQYPGLVGMLANAGSLDQVGIPFYKTFGNIADDAVLARVRSRILAISAANRLKGQTFGLFGGRSLGIDTAVADPAVWMEQFGIDVDHVDQMELVRRAKIEMESPDSRINDAFEYLKKTVRKIHWTEPDAEMVLTEDLLRRQLGMYYAALDLCREFKYDFCGIKGQRELTEHFATADVAEAFLNDPYGPDGKEKEMIVCSTEADMDAALTMQIFKHMANTPVLFADIRHYHSDLGVWDLCNSGEHATYFAGKSFNPEENLARTEFRPEGFYFPAGGASVYHIARPGKFTFARLTRSGSPGNYRMAIIPGELVSFGDEKDEEIAVGVQDNWPHAYAKMDCSPETFINGMHCNHIHGVYGDWVEELKIFCEVRNIECDILTD